MKHDPLPLKRLMFMMFMNRFPNMLPIIDTELGRESRNLFKTWNLDQSSVMSVSSIFIFSRDGARDSLFPFPTLEYSKTFDRISLDFQKLMNHKTTFINCFCFRQY